MASFNAQYSLEPDHVFEGKYRILRELGSGGFGMVYLAHQISMDRPVALKILKPGVGARAPSARERFLREVRIISKLRHPNTVTIHDYGETVHGVVYMVLEYVEGRTLKQLLKQEGAQDPMRALGIVRQIARSLAEAHSHGIVHRDLKPANIMLADVDADSDFVKVLDFGVARLLGSEDMDLTSAGVPEGERALIGTPRYMSPEQVRGEDLNGASDLYSLGLIFYEMLVGEPAVQGDTTMGLISQQLSPEPLRLPSLQALPPCVQRLLLRATDKSIHRRFTDANEMARAIDETALRLGEELGVRGRAATGAYFASSGRFAAIPRSSALAAQASEPFTNVTPDAFASTTPSGARPNPLLDNPEVHREPAHAQASSEPSLNYYESSFEPDQLTGNSPPGDPAGHPAQPSPDNSNFPLVRNEVDFQEPSGLLGIPSADLPLPPDISGSPFADPEPSEEIKLDTSSAQPSKPMPYPSHDDNLLGFAFVILKICFLATLAISFIYVAFLTMGALVGEFTEGTMRIAIASSIALAIPLFTALGENSQKERFEVVKRPTDRIARVLIGSTIFAAGAAFIICFSMPGNVTDQLRNDPNWMFKHVRGVTYEPTSTTAMNRRVSEVIADMVETTMVAIGRYDGTPTSASESLFAPDSAPSAPPAPTRPGTRHEGDSAERHTVPDETATDEANETDDTSEAQRPPPRRNSPPPTRPGTRTPNDSSDPNGESDYVRW